MTRTTSRTERGFTTIEAIVSLGLFATAMIGLATLPITTVRANTWSRNVSAAANLARDKVEEFRNTDYSTLSSGSDGAALDESGQSGTTGAVYSRSWAVASGPATGTKQVEVKVSWTDAALREITLHTVISE